MNDDAPDEGEKTFDQAAVDRIVQDRIARERAKFDGWVSAEDHAAVVTERDSLAQSVASYERKDFLNGLVTEFGVDPDALPQGDNDTIKAHAELIKSIADEHKVDPSLLFGKDRDALTARATKLAALAPAPEAPGETPVSPRPKVNSSPKSTTPKARQGASMADFNAVFKL